MKFGVVVFPGSNCDADCFHAIKDVIGQDVNYLWHKDPHLDSYDCIVLPGGFSYGDYLRAGAIARFSPIMKAVAEFAARGGLVIGICNGFQILCEYGLLPGALRRNESLRFQCHPVRLRVENASTPFTRLCRPGQVLEMPIAHAQGNYYADPETLQRLRERGQIVLRYCDQFGEVSRESNPNGSVDNIAAVCNESRNVLGMMPHPERNCDPLLGNGDGRFIFDSIVEAVEEVVGA